MCITITNILKIHPTGMATLKKLMGTQPGVKFMNNIYTAKDRLHPHQTYLPQQASQSLAWSTKLLSTQVFNFIKSTPGGFGILIAVHSISS